MKTEHEKLLAGEEYDYRDAELQGIMQKAAEAVTKLNQTTLMVFSRKHLLALANVL